jgi:hypothetical protein
MTHGEANHRSYILIRMPKVHRERERERERERDLDRYNGQAYPLADLKI